MMLRSPKIGNTSFDELFMLFSKTVAYMASFFIFLFYFIHLHPVNDFPLLVRLLFVCPLISWTTAHPSGLNLADESLGD